MSINYIKAYNNRLKQQLCCYIELLDNLIGELQTKAACEEAGPAVSHITQQLFRKMIDDPMINLYDSCNNPVNMSCAPVESYGVNLIDCKGSLYCQYTKSALAMQGCHARDITDLGCASTELFPKLEEEDVTYVEAVCCLKQHFIYIRDNLCVMEFPEPILNITC